jgi:hypothetical protein
MSMFMNSGRNPGVFLMNLGMVLRLRLLLLILLPNGSTRFGQEIVDMNWKDLPLIGTFFNPYHQSRRRVRKASERAAWRLGDTWMLPTVIRNLPTGEEFGIPWQVIEAFNIELLNLWDGFSGLAVESMVIDRITKAMGISENAVLENRYLDIVECYAASGWDVKYYSGVGAYYRFDSIWL